MRESNTCAGKTVKDCDDGDACNIDDCDTSKGCVHSPRSCDDGVSSTTDSCAKATGCENKP